MRDCLAESSEQKKELTFQKKRIGRHTYEKESKEKVR